MTSGRRRSTAAALVAIVAVLSGCGGATPTGRPAHRAAGLRPAAGPAPPPAAAPIDARDGQLVARVLRRTPLLAGPGGREVAPIGPRTGWGSERIMAVAASRGGAWVGVRAPELANGRLGWVAARDVELLRATWRITVDLSARRLTARLPGRRRFVVPIAVGGPRSPTPTGRFSVTDRLVLDPGTPYGCCILALSGHQPNVPQGWGGGDLIAIHGTTSEASIGSAVSGGCLRARAADMRRLMSVIPLGTTVVIRA